MKWNNDQELFELIRQYLYTPVVGDILDTLGLWHQFLPQPIHAAREGMVLAGRAMPVQLADATGPQAKPFGRLTEALDQIEPGEVYVVTGGSQNCAAWGEILTATARTRGGAGAVINGFHRDTPRVLEQNWPVFSRGRWAQDAGVRSVVINFRCTIEIDGVPIHPGELIFGDVDGVVVVPKAVEQKVIELALEKATGEKLVRKDIEAGLSSTDAFKKYGILLTRMATAFKIAAGDNVATLLENSDPGKVQLRGEGLQEDSLSLIEAIELGHKTALQYIAPGEKIVKYGVVIGLASRAIQCGEWVHLHNCHSRLDERSATLDLHTGLPGDTRYA